MSGCLLDRYPRFIRESPLLNKGGGKVRTVLAAWALGMMLMASAHAWAENAQLVAVLPVEQAPDTGLTQSELNDLTALARGTAADVLGDQFIVMTEQNMQRILKGMGLTLEQCQSETGDCAVEIARKLQADHVVTGKVRSAFGKLTLNLELYATENGDLIVARRVSVKAKEEFEEKIRPAMANTLMKLPGMSSGGGLDFQLQERRDTRGSNWKSSGASLDVVKFQSTPPGATILVDGKVVCQGKPYCSKALTPGLHKVQMHLERHVSREEMVDTASIAQIDWQLEEDFARLSVDTNPPGVEIVIDGTPMGPGPHVDLELGVGAHVVKAGGDRCYKEHRKELRLNRGDVEKHTLEPVRKNAGLMVRASDDAGNDLMVDVRSGDVRLGRSFEPLTIGLCTPNLNIRTEDDRSLPINVSLDENQMQEVQITVPRELSREEKRTRSRADRERRSAAKRDQKEREAERARLLQQKVAEYQEEAGNHGTVIGLATLVVVITGIASAAPFAAADLANDDMNVSLAAMQTAEAWEEYVPHRDDALDHADERDTQALLGWALVGTAGVATLVAIIAGATMPDVPTRTSMGDENPTDSWSAGPTSTGDGFQIHWGAQW